MQPAPTTEAEALARLQALGPRIDTIADPAVRSRLATLQRTAVMHIGIMDGDDVVDLEAMVDAAPKSRAIAGDQTVRVGAGNAGAWSKLLGENLLGAAIGASLGGWLGHRWAGVTGGVVGLIVAGALGAVAQEFVSFGTGGKAVTKLPPPTPSRSSGKPSAGVLALPMPKTASSTDRP